MELTIAIAITGIAIAAISSLALDVTGFGTSLGGRLEQEMELEPFLRLVVTEIRSMGTADNGSYPIAQAMAQTLTFYSDIDLDGQFERVRYFVDGTTLKRGVIEPVETQPVSYPPANEVVSEIVHHLVPGTIFTYFPEGYPPSATPLPSPVAVAKIRLITVTGSIDQNADSGPGSITLSASATIRNLRGDI